MDLSSLRTDKARFELSDSVRMSDLEFHEGDIGDGSDGASLSEHSAQSGGESTLKSGDKFMKDFGNEFKEIYDKAMEQSNKAKYFVEKAKKQSGGKSHRKPRTEKGGDRGGDAEHKKRKENPAMAMGMTVAKQIRSEGYMEKYDLPWTGLISIAHAIIKNAMGKVGKTAEIKVIESKALEMAKDPKQFEQFVDAYRLVQKEKAKDKAKAQAGGDCPFARSLQSPQKLYY